MIEWCTEEAIRAQILSKLKKSFMKNITSMAKHNNFAQSWWQCFSGIFVWILKAYLRPKTDKNNLISK